MKLTRKRIAYKKGKKPVTEHYQVEVDGKGNVIDGSEVALELDKKGEKLIPVKKTEPKAKPPVSVKVK